MTFDVVLLVVSLALLLGGYLRRIDASSSMRGVAVFAFAVRVAFVLVDDVLRVFAGSGDALVYELTLWFVAQQWRIGVLLAPLNVSSGPGLGGYYAILYSAVLSPIYLLFGRSPVLVRLTMAFFGALVVVNVYLIGRKLVDERAGLYAGAITAVFPYWIQLNGILYRDTLVILLLSWMAFYLLKWQANSDRRALWLCLVATVLALSLRLENIPAVAALFGVAVYTKFESSIRQMMYAAIALSGSFSIFLYRFGDEITVRQLAGRRRWLARERTASYLTGFGYESWIELIVFAPIGMLYFALVPFPWQAVNTLAVVSILQNLFIWYPVVVLAIVGARDSLSLAGAEKTLPLVAFALAGLFSYGLVEGNIGPAMRHRSQFQFVFIVFAGVALSLRVRIAASSSRSPRYEVGRKVGDG